MKRWKGGLGLALIATFGLAENASAQVGYGIGFGSGYVPTYSSGVSLSVGRGVGFSSGYNYGYAGVRPYGYGAYRPYGGYGPIHPSPYGVGYSYVGAPVFGATVVRRPVYRYRQPIRRRF